MKINEIILKEELDQKEADMVYQGLISSSDPYDRQVAQSFMKTRNDPRHASVDSAQQAAETQARNEMKKKVAKIKQAEADGKIKVQEPNKQSEKIKREYSDKFYGNQYVQIKRDTALVQDLKKYLPIIDQGIVKATSSGLVAGANLSGAFDTGLMSLLPATTVKYQSKFGSKPGYLQK